MIRVIDFKKQKRYENVLKSFLIIILTNIGENSYIFKNKCLIKYHPYKKDLEIESKGNVMCTCPNPGCLIGIIQSNLIFGTFS